MKWKQIAGFPDYTVSDRGGIKKTTTPMRVLKLSKTTGGYLFARLRKNKKEYRVAAHRIVLRAFTGPCPPDHQCNHLNGIKTDNRAKNLEWVTASENLRHAYKNGLRGDNRGENNPYAKLTRNQVFLIRCLLKSGIKQRIIAEWFGVSRGAINNIHLRRSWKKPRLTTHTILGLLAKTET